MLKEVEEILFASSATLKTTSTATAGVLSQEKSKRRRPGKQTGVDIVTVEDARDQSTEQQSSIQTPKNAEHKCADTFKKTVNIKPKPIFNPMHYEPNSTSHNIINNNNNNATASFTYSTPEFFGVNNFVNASNDFYSSSNYVHSSDDLKLPIVYEVSSSDGPESDCSKASSRSTSPNMSESKSNLPASSSCSASPSSSASVESVKQESPQYETLQHSSAVYQSYPFHDHSFQSNYYNTNSVAHTSYNNHPGIFQPYSNLPDFQN